MKTHQGHMMRPFIPLESGPVERTDHKRKNLQSPQLAVTLKDIDSFFAIPGDCPPESQNFNEKTLTPDHTEYYLAPAGYCHHVPQKMPRHKKARHVH
jgi:hypothetical protein